MSAGTSGRVTQNSFLPDLQQLAGQRLLPDNRLVQQTLMHHIVDILQEDDVPVHSRQVAQQGTVSAGTVERLAVGLEERSIVLIDSDDVGRRILDAEGDVVLAAEALLVLGHGLLQDLLEAGLMSGRDGEMYPHLAGGAAGIEGTLHQMLLECSAHLSVIAVEQHLSLGPVAVVQAGPAAGRCSLTYHMVQDTERSQTAEILRGVECEPADIVHELPGLGGRIQRLARRQHVPSLEEVLEHTGGRSGGRHELDHLAGEAVIPVHRSLPGPVVHNLDASCRRSRRLQFQKRKSFLEIFDKPVHTV